MGGKQNRWCYVAVQLAAVVLVGHTSGCQSQLDSPQPAAARPSVSVAAELHDGQGPGEAHIQLTVLPQGILVPAMGSSHVISRAALTRFLVREARSGMGHGPIVLSLSWLQQDEFLVTLADLAKAVGRVRRAIDEADTGGRGVIVVIRSAVLSDELATDGKDVSSK